jgi:hypothetical protein
MRVFIHLNDRLPDIGRHERGAAGIGHQLVEPRPTRLRFRQGQNQIVPGTGRADIEQPCPFCPIGARRRVAFAGIGGSRVEDDVLLLSAEGPWPKAQPSSLEGIVPIDVATAMIADHMGAEGAPLRLVVEVGHGRRRAGAVPFLLVCGDECAQGFEIEQPIFDTPPS